jgi:hypothetical protein
MTGPRKIASQIKIPFLEGLPEADYHYGKRIILAC